MKKLILSLGLALLGFVGLSQAASATTIPINPNPIAVFSDSAGPNESITNSYQFSFTGSADGEFGALSLLVSGLDTKICTTEDCSGIGNLVKASGTTTSGPFGLISLSLGSFTDLVGGTYFLVVSGLASSFGGGYLGALQLNVTATPIPPALVLFLTAIGGLGGFGYFRRKASGAA
jgi:hypothetical protein